MPANTRRIPLPGYPFGGERHWFKRRAQALAAPASPALNLALPIESNAVSAVPVPLLVTPPEIPAVTNRLPQLETELKRILSDVSGLSADEMHADATFVDQGLDSLSLTQATLEFERVFGIKLRFRRLLEDLDTIAKLVAFLDAELPPDRFAPPAPAAAQSVADTRMPTGRSAGKAARTASSDPAGASSSGRLTRTTPPTSV